MTPASCCLAVLSHLVLGASHPAYTKIGDDSEPRIGRISALMLSAAFERNFSREIFNVATDAHHSGELLANAKHHGSIPRFQISRNTSIPAPVPDVVDVQIIVIAPENGTIAKRTRAPSTLRAAACP